MKRDYALCWVGLKLLLKKDRKILFLKTAMNPVFWDLPGGRIDNVEGKVPLEKILEREIREELGNKVKYKLGRPVFQFRRKGRNGACFNLLTAYEAKYLGGKINLSFEHSAYEWVDPKKYKFNKNDFFNKEEYRAFTKYFRHN